jgi:hypothetical protein
VGLMYINGGKRRRKARRSSVKFPSTYPGSRKRGRRAGAANPSTSKRSSMRKKRRKLFGAAAAAHARKRAKGRRRSNPGKRPRAKRRKLFGAAAMAVARAKSKRKRRTAGRRRVANPSRRRRRRNPLSGLQARAYIKHRGRGLSALEAYRLAAGREAGAHKKRRVARKSAATRAKKRRSAARKTTTRKKKRSSSMAKKRRSRSKAARRPKKGSRRSSRAKGRRRKRNPAMVVNPPKRRRRRRARRANPAPKRRRRRARRSAARRTYRRRRRNPFNSRTARAAAKKSWRNRRRRSRAGRALRLRRSKSAARYLGKHSRFRKNPGGLLGMFKEVAVQVLPMAASVYLSRVAANKAASIPVLGAQLDKLGRFRRPVVAAAILVGAHFLSAKVKPLQRYRSGIMLGAGFNVLDALVSALAPESVKQFIMLSDDEGIYDNALSEYANINDYVGIGDNYEQEMGDYVGIGAEEDLGALEELGYSQEMGDNDPLDRALLGGTGRGDMVAPVGSTKMLAAVPNRSFSKEVPDAGTGYDRQAKVQTGIFAGGF